MMDGYTHVKHGFEPVFDGRSRVLILGTLPSVKSRESEFYYGHPQNRFWRLMAAITDERIPVSIGEKKELLLRHGIAVWDVIGECDIVGSSDASIKNVMPADLGCILESSQIELVCANGALAGKLYRRYQQAATGREIMVLPSTSPANAAWSFERLLETWSAAIGGVII